MKQLGGIVQDSRSLVRGYGEKSNNADKMLTLRQRSNLPTITNRLTDVDMPLRLWDSWTQDGHPKKLRRELTADECAALTARRDELAPWVSGYHPEAEFDEVVLALIDMFTGFQSMSAEAGAARVESVARLLRDFPLWVVEASCKRIRLRGYVRDDKIERHWPPSDPELVAMIKTELSLYERSYDSAVALLNGEVCEDGLR